MKSALREPSLAREATHSTFTPFASFSDKILTVSELLGPLYTAEMKEAFPDLLPPYKPFGFLALLQLRTPRTMSKGGIHLPDETQDGERYRTQAALVRALGFSCFRDRQTGDMWLEGAWFKVGDFVRAPMYGGDRFNIEYKDSKGNRNEVTFMFIKDSDVSALVTGDPLTIKTS